MIWVFWVSVQDIVLIEGYEDNDIASLCVCVNWVTMVGRPQKWNNHHNVSDMSALLCHYYYYYRKMGMKYTMCSNTWLWNCHY